MKLNILHIGCTNGDMCNGVQVVVPQHLNAQSKYANIAFVNISNIEIGNDILQFEYSKQFSVSKLPKPFCKPNLVVFHECYRIQYIGIAKELRKINVPYIIIPHGELSDEAQKKKYLKKRIANILIFNKFINNAVGIQLLSDVELKNTNFGKSKFIGTNGINIPNDKKNKFNNKGLRIIYIGRLDSYHKGLDLLINSIGEIADFLRINNCVFDIYGPDILGRKLKLEKLIQDNKVEDIVVLHNSVFGEKKEKVLLASDVFIQTSRFEGMPMGVLEAMSYGLPCIVTEGTTLRSIVEMYQAGWGGETSVESICSMLRKMIEEKEFLTEMSNNSINAIKKEFSWDSIAKSTVAKYEKLI